MTGMGENTSEINFWLLPWSVSLFDTVVARAVERGCKNVGFRFLTKT